MANPPLTIDQIEAIAAMNKAGKTDAETARIMGISNSAVSKYRRKLGLPAHDVRFMPTAAQIAELRECSDREMHRRYGVDHCTWSRIRKRHGIAPYRQPTVVDGVPAPWVVKPEKREPFFDGFWRCPDPRRDHSLTGEAAAHLQRDRFAVFNREKLGMGEGWAVGRMILSAADMVAMAVRRGFEPRPWMGTL